MAYLIWLRTPFKIVYNASGIDLSFIPAPTAAGVDGQLLKPGQGAWPDRPLVAGEPAVVRLPVNGDVTGKPFRYDYLLEGALLRAAIVAPNTLIGVTAESVNGLLLCRSGWMGTALISGVYGGSIKIYPAAP